MYTSEKWREIETDERDMGKRDRGRLRQMRGTRGRELEGD